MKVILGEIEKEANCPEKIKPLLRVKANYNRDKGHIEYILSYFINFGGFTCNHIEEAFPCPKNKKEINIIKEIIGRITTYYGDCHGAGGVHDNKVLTFQELRKWFES